jgi:hypothetical protein
MIHEHTCLHCPATATSEAASSPQLVLPEGWHWWTRMSEGLNAAVCCPSCGSAKIGDRNMRRIGGPISRANRDDARG